MSIGDNHFSVWKLSYITYKNSIINTNKNKTTGSRCLTGDKDENIKNNNLNIYYDNARSIRNKMIFLEFLLSSNKYDIICLVDDRDSLYLIGGKNYILFRYDKLIHRGGVAIFFKSSLCPVRNCISYIDFQYIYLKINSKIPFNIICVYRPPNCNAISHEHIC